MTRSRTYSAVAVLMGVWLVGSLSAAWAQIGDSSKIGVFDPSRVFELSQLGKQMRGEIETLSQAKRAEVKEKEEELRELQEKFRQEEPSLSQDRLNERERELQQKGIEFKRVKDDANREVQSQVNDVQQKFQEEVLKVIENLGREGGYVIILDSAAVAFVSPAVDITDLIVSRLNVVTQSTAESR